VNTTGCQRVDEGLRYAEVGERNGHEGVYGQTPSAAATQSVGRADVFGMIPSMARFRERTQRST
jgi:hypothetical protein